MEATTLPGVTPGLLRAGDSWCPRRLACDFEDRDQTRDFFARGRLRDVLLAGARDAHLSLRTPDRTAFRPSPELVDDERHAFGVAVDGYMELFGDTAALAVIDHGADRAMPSPRHGVRIKGWLDLVVTDAAGQVELRQFELWHRDLCADPNESWEMLCAAARLRPWLAGRPLRIVHADLYSATADTVVWDPADAPVLSVRFGERVAELLDLADLSDARPGVGCLHCGHVAGCPALRGG